MRHPASAFAPIVAAACTALLLLAPGADARPTAVIQVAIVDATLIGDHIDVAKGEYVNGPYTAMVARPGPLIDAKDGDIIKICNRTRRIAKLFSGSRYNTFGGGLGGKPSSGLRVNSGGCTKVTVHNPSTAPLVVKIGSETDLNGTPFKLWVKVAPGASVAAGTFNLEMGLTEINNVNGTNLTSLDAGAGTAHVEQGPVVWDETWKLPETITPGKRSSITLGLEVTNNGPKPGPGQYDVGISVIAPDLTKQLLLDISSKLTGTQVYTWTIEEDPNAQELVIVIHPYESSTVTYHYRRSG